MKKILINVAPWQTRIAVTDDEKLQNIYFAAHATQTLERTFFKGKVVKVLPGIQTAFVGIGQEKSGFLHISEIDRELAIQRMSGGDDELELEDSNHHVEERRERPDISKILKEGEPILVQVSKEPIGEKGAKLTTCFTLPGRFIVLMPNIPRIGISKKIENREERQRLREIVRKNLPETAGCIIRTNCEGKSEREILADITYLLRTWEEIQKAYESAKFEEKLYEDIDLSLQIVRDCLDEDIEFVVCDDKQVHAQVYKFVKNIAPEHIHKIRLYTDPLPLFEKFEVEKQIDEALEHKVRLKSGGSIVIESTEAMTVVDVNTGRFIGNTNLEETILKTNLEAAEEIVRQLQLRNIGGLIVIDFIDMATGANRQRLFRSFEKRLRETDKLQSVVLRVSEFGLVQMTRKRSGKTLQGQLTETCSCCHGSGAVASAQTEAYRVLRKLQKTLASRKGMHSVTVLVHPDVFTYITTVEYDSILKLEKEYTCRIIVEGKEIDGLETCAIQGS